MPKPKNKKELVPNVLRLNLGCGTTKLPGYVNIDVEPNCKPDLVLNFINEKLPYKDGSVEEVVMFHTIEHIRKAFHTAVLLEINRVLKPDGRVYFAYPEFLKCVRAWEKNLKGQRDFWEATIFGRQAYPSDFHVCIIDSEQFSLLLKNCGFKDITYSPETHEKQNTMLKASKGQKRIPYEDLINQDMNNIQIIKKRA